MKFNEFCEAVKEEYLKRFPTSLCNVRLFNCLGKSILIDCYLASDSKECINRLFANDIFKVKADIVLPDKFDINNDDLPEKMTIKWLSHCYFIVPENDYFAYGKRNISARSTSGKPEKLVKDFGKFFDRLEKSVKEDLSNEKIHKGHLKLVVGKLTK